MVRGAKVQDTTAAAGEGRRAVRVLRLAGCVIDSGALRLDIQIPIRIGGFACGVRRGRRSPTRRPNPNARPARRPCAAVPGSRESAGRVLGRGEGQEGGVHAERTIGVERILARDGYWCRGAPTGFQNGRLDGKPTLVPNAENGQWELLRYGLQKQLTGAYSLRAVADELKRKGFRTSKGNPFSRQSWWNICTSPVYGGMLRGKWTDGEYVRAKFDGPLTPDQWQRLHRCRDRRRGVADRAGNGRGLGRFG